MKKIILTAILSTHQKITNLFTYANNLRCGISPHPQAFTKNHKIRFYVLAYGALFLASPFAALAHMAGENGDYSNMMGFSGDWMWVGMSFAWIIAVLLIVLLVLVIIKLLKK